MGIESTVSAVEIVMSWKGTVLESDLVELARPRNILVGSQGAVRFLVPEEALPAGQAEVLAAENGRFFLRAPAGATLVAGKDGAIVEGALDATGGVAIELVPGVSGEVKIGDFAFFARMVGALEDARPAAAFDFRPLRWTLAAVAFHAALLGSFLFAPPDASAMNLDLSRANERYIEAHLTPPVEIAELLDMPASPSTGGGTSTGDDSPAPVAGGGAGGTASTSTGGPGSPHAHAVVTHGPVTPTTVNDLAIWGGLASVFANTGTESGAFGLDSLTEGPGGVGLYAALAAGPGGTGGLDMNGTGIGTCTGDHCGEGTIGVGPLATHSGHGTPDGTLHGREGGGVPAVTPGPVETFGGLGREDVRRTMRRHRNDVYSCYEAALRSNPGLEGRVTLAFTVDSSGVVHTPRVVSSEGGVDSVGTCVVRSLEHWTFPTSTGMTGVTAYPFVFSHGE